MAERLGYPRPSYEQVRVLLNARRREAARVTGLQVVEDVFLWNTRPAWDLITFIDGDPLPRRSGAHNEPRRNPRK